jgi:endoribonuclease Dicer
MAMVSNKFLGALAVKLGLHRHLRHFSNPLQSQITHYADDIQTAEDESEGAVDYWVTVKDSPKVGRAGQHMVVSCRLTGLSACPI